MSSHPCQNHIQAPRLSAESDCISVPLPTAVIFSFRYPHNDCTPSATLLPGPLPGGGHSLKGTVVYCWANIPLLQASQHNTSSLQLVYCLASNQEHRTMSGAPPVHPLLCHLKSKSSCIAPSAAAWNVVADGGTTITWVCGVLSGVQLLKSVINNIENHSVGGLIRRTRGRLQTLRDQAAKLTPHERRLIDAEHPVYLLQTEEFIKSYGSSTRRLYVLKLNLILGRADDFLDRLECDYNQGLFPTWKVYGPNFGGNDIKKKIIETEKNTIALWNNLMVSHVFSG